jgi:hypothetical protein
LYFACSGPRTEANARIFETCLYNARIFSGIFHLLIRDIKPRPKTSTGLLPADQGRNERPEKMTFQELVIQVAGSFR